MSMDPLHFYSKQDIEAMDRSTMLFGLVLLGVFVVFCAAISAVAYVLT